MKLHNAHKTCWNCPAIDFGLGGRIFVDLHRFACQRLTDAAVALTGLPVEWCLR